MNKNINTKRKITRKVFALVVLFTAFAVFLTNGTNYARTVDQTKLASSTEYEKEIAYTFKIKNKLEGTGNVKILATTNKIRGIAKGIGKTSICNVDFQTNLSGIYDDKADKVKIVVRGNADPLRTFSVGKVSFHGPLKGKLKGKKLKLKGKVIISGIAASFAGFNKTEELVIEISDSTLASHIREIKHSLASL